jgi:hypothetical protein
VSEGILSGVDAANRMASWTRYATGKCLEAVYVALGSHASDRPGFYTYALRALETVPAGNRHYDRTPPKGAIVFFSAGRNGYGHICISVGGGNVVSTDIPASGRVGITSIATIEKAWGRRFLCWTNWVMGYDISTAEPTAGTGGGASREVANQQAWMNQARGEKLAVDGIIGKATKAAIKRYQGFLGVTADGIWGARTQAAHQAYYDRVNAPAPAGSDLIRAVQAKLKANYPLYAGKLAVDGIKGSATTAAVKEFQRRSGLVADGIIGPKTRAKLGV